PRGTACRPCRQPLPSPEDPLICVGRGLQHAHPGRPSSFWCFRSCPWLLRREQQVCEAVGVPFAFLPSA
ncbi:unnamed protein product, partial [Ectocarpus sp. 8 AP-2014]